MLTPEHAQLLANILLINLEREVETTKRVIAAIPVDQMTYTLGEKGRPVKDVAWHIITTDIRLLNGVADGAFAKGEAIPAPKTPADMVSYYTNGINEALHRVKELTPEQLARPILFHGVVNMPAAWYLGFIENHSIHHRGQLSLYLRALNAHVPGIYGPSADEPGPPERSE